LSLVLIMVLFRCWPLSHRITHYHGSRWSNWFRLQPPASRVSRCVSFPSRSLAHAHCMLSFKYSDYEGGVRSAAFVSGPVLPHSQRGGQYTGLMHIADW
jgi:hypothetical protein